MVSERKKVYDLKVEPPAEPVLVVVLPDESAEASAAKEPEAFRSLILHSLPGRVRLQIEGLRWEKIRAERLCRAVIEEPGIKRARLSLFSSSLVIEYDPDIFLEREVIELLEEIWCRQDHEFADYDVVPAGEDFAAAHPVLGGILGFAGRLITRVIDFIDRLTPHPVQLLVSGLAFGGALFGLPVPVTRGLLALGSLPILSRATRTALVERKLGVDGLDGAAAVLMLIQGNFKAAGFMTTLIALGECIREQTSRKCEKMIEDLLGLAGRSAWVVRGKKRILLPADTVVVGDTVVVYAGEMVPVDGIVTSGRATIDQSKLTGESVPAEVDEGSIVYASTVLHEGKIYVNCSAVGMNTRAGLVVDLVNSAPRFETRTQNYASLAADKFVTPVLTLGLLSFVATRNLTHMMTILIFDFATGIRIAAPTAVLASMQKAARSGVLIKSGAALENLAQVDAVLFDKTGTLTMGEPHVTSVFTYNGYDRTDVIRYAASVEMRNNHPAARAIVRFAQKEKVSIPERSSSETHSAMGVEAIVEGHRVLVGNRLFLDRCLVDVSASHEQAQAVGEACESFAYVAIDGKLAALMSYCDQLRPESKAVVQALRKRGVKRIVMATGDSEGPARAMAKKVGVDQVHFCVFPEQKASIVKDLQHQGYKVAVVGDGINDSPALAHADVAISLHGGTDIAREKASVVLTDDNLTRLPQAIDLARSSLALVHQSISIVTLPNAIGLGLATFGSIGPAMATALNNGSAIVAGLNSLRPLLIDDSPRSK
ncbi:MAG: heavy metal translocating P-type ATPase [Cyanobacteria bacterium SZAS TMP-1]|nr:heavy metal translocating P-type ATPase [Cyanobacteria bacterium SZAS TMP-1]